MISIGLLGHGTVGSGFLEIFNKNFNALQEEFGELKVSKVLVKNLEKHSKKIDSDVLTNDESDFLSSKFNIVIETIGGTGPAYDYVKQFLENGIHVVTANKDLIAKHGVELFSIARKNNARLMYEASVGGGIPVIKPLKNSISGNSIVSIRGILNGTTNFMLTQMDKRGLSYEEALKIAQEKGFAEADPSSDVLGYDSARKLSILSSIAYKKSIDWESIYTEGICDIDDFDIKYAKKLKSRIKLVGESSLRKGKVSASVRPLIIPEDNHLATTSNEFNLINVESDYLGEVSFYGKGAGKSPTGTSVYSDLIDILKRPEEIDCDFASSLEQVSRYRNVEENYYLRIKSKHRYKVIDRIIESFSEVNLDLDRKIPENNVIAILKNQEDSHVFNTVENLRSCDFIEDVKFVKILKDIIN